MKHALTLLALTALAALSACRSSRMGHDKDHDAYRAAEGVYEVETDLGDVRLGEVAVERMRSTRPADLGGLPRVEFDLVSSAPRRLPFEWRLRWFDAAGAELHGPDHWRPTTLEVEETRAMTVVAPVPTATGWEVALRSRHESN